MTKQISILVIILICQWHIHAQMITPPVSSHVHMTQTVGFTDITLDYSRPNTKGRTIFGSLIPYNEVWRAGANQCSKISFSEKVHLDDQIVEPGTYSMFFIPTEDQWTFLLNSDTSLWGATGFDPTKNVAHFMAKPKEITHVETLVWALENVDYAYADLTLKWSDHSFSIPLKFETDQQTMTRISTRLNENPTGQDYYHAARYLLETDGDLNLADQYMQKRVALDGNQFGILRYKAIIEHKLGRVEEAIKTMMLSKEMAIAAGNDHYVLMNEKSLREWIKEKSDISGPDLLDQSIQYHDPAGKWKNELFDISLYETRPGGTARYSHIKMSAGQEIFHLEQWREKDLIVRSLKGEKCIVTLNGKSDIPEEKIKQFRLTCDESQFYKNYYLYLWGLPMKLKDEGTIIHNEVYQKDFEGQQLLEMKVTYQKDVGTDIWYFYFDPGTKALSGYRFYHDESKNDGEYITLEGEALINGVKMPAKRNWYTHKDRKYLGSDELIWN